MTGTSGPTEPVPNTNASKVLAAAMELEDLAKQIGGIVKKMRDNPGDIDTAYAMVYHWRSRLGAKVLSRLGKGKPSYRSM